MKTFYSDAGEMPRALVLQEPLLNVWREQSTGLINFMNSAPFHLPQKEPV